MKLRLLSIIAAVALVAACESAPKSENNASAGSAAPAATSNATNPSVVPGSQADFVANVGDRVFFAYDKSDLSGDARAVLGKWVAFLKQYPNDKLTVEGHCDERGTVEFNLGLGARRANAVKQFLVAQGVDAGRLATTSFGKSRPAVVGHDEAAWSQNRRGVGVIQ